MIATLALLALLSATARAATWRGRAIVYASDSVANEQTSSFPLEYASSGVAITMAALLGLCAIFHWASLALSSFSRSGVQEEDSVTESLLVESNKSRGQVPATRRRFYTVLSGYLDARVNGLNSVRTVLVAAVYVAVSLGWSLYWIVKWPNGQVMGTKDRVARVLGQLNTVNMLVAVVPATRYSILWLLLGAPFDRTLPLHRWAGTWTALILLGHLVTCFIALGKGVVWYNGTIDKYAMYGLSAFICCVFVAVTSLERVRRAHFNIFRYSHFAFLPFFIFAVLHEKPVMLPYAIAAACIYGLDRVLRFLSSALPHDAEVVALSDRVMRVRWPKPKLCPPQQTGQYVFLNFPGAGTAAPLEWHPFTLCSAPASSHFEVNIRGLGDYTSQLQTALKEGSRVRVRQEGPYGRLALSLGGYRSLALACNGIGITPMASILREAYGIDAPSAPPPFGAVRSIVLHWGVRTRQQYAWFADLIEQCHAAADASKGSLPQLTVVVHIDGEGDNLKFEQPFVGGRIDNESLVHDAALLEPSAVIACGVPEMVTDLWDKCATRRRNGEQVDFHFESFLF